MSEMEVLILSAKACGYTHNIGKNGCVFIYQSYGPTTRKLFWEPFTNAEQRWECVMKLLEMGYCMVLSNAEWGKSEVGWLSMDGCVTRALRVDSPASEFPARALAVLQKKQSDGAAQETSTRSAEA